MQMPFRNNYLFLHKLNPLVFQLNLELYVPYINFLKNILDIYGHTLQPKTFRIKQTELHYKPD